MDVQASFGGLVQGAVFGSSSVDYDDILPVLPAQLAAPIDEAIQRAADAAAAIPPQPSSPGALARDAADRVLASWRDGKPHPALDAAAEVIDRFDVSMAAHLIGRHVADTLKLDAVRLTRQMLPQIHKHIDARIRDVQREYEQIITAPGHVRDELEAYRAGGKARTAWDRAEALRVEYDALRAAWEQARALERNGRYDPSTALLSALFIGVLDSDERKLDYEYDLTGHALDIAVRLDLMLWAPTREQQDQAERAEIDKRKRDAANAA